MFNGHICSNIVIFSYLNDIAVASGQLYKIRDIVRTVLTRGIAGEGTAFAALDTGGGVMPVKEHFLPLSYISKIAVIENTDNDRQFVCHGCSHFLDVHLEASVT